MLFDCTPILASRLPPTQALSSGFVQRHDPGDGLAKERQPEVQKPMTIQFKATNEKAVSWTKRVGLGLFGFLALWGIVGAGLRPTETSATEQAA